MEFNVLTPKINDNMKYLITKTVVLYDNGDQRNLKWHIPTDDLEVTRKQLQEELQCKKISFTYEDLTQKFEIPAEPTQK